MALTFAPPPTRVSVKLELEPDVHAALQKAVDEHNTAHGSNVLTIDQAASSILNDAVRKAAKPNGSRRKKGVM